MEEWLIKLMELSEMVKMTKEKTLSYFNANWKPLLNFGHETEKYKIMMYRFAD